MAKTKALQAKKKQAKKAPITPEVLPPAAQSPPAFAMDGTVHCRNQLIMQNIYYSKEIIEETRAAFSIERLKAKIADDKT